jgi:redox-sensitive bicupin YhaK (pirin superfamily)
VVRIRKSQQRGTADHGWLYSRHTFSFGDYYDPMQMGFGPLRVINEDRVRPAMGFPTHEHQDMEIISYVLEGALEHKDSIGTGSVIRPGDVQIMSAGTGIRHSEFNHSKVEPVHFLQIWIVPNRLRVAPRYEQKAFPDADKRGQLRLVGSPDGRDGSLTIYQDVRLLAGLFSGGEQATHALAGGRSAWLQIARGSVRLNGHELEAGDGAAIESEPSLSIAATRDGTEVLLFDLPKG